MCFSPTASFTAAIVLATIGVVSVKKVNNNSQLVFASIPIVFAFQQLAEGALWLTIPNPKYQFLRSVATYVYLFFAQTIWPLLVPLAILLLEKTNTRKIFQRILVTMGLIASFYLTYCLLTFDVEAKIVGSHIWYKQDYPIIPRRFCTVIYIIAIIAPAFFSHIKNMWMLGVVIMISFCVSAIFYRLYLISVWCFFASIISIFVYVIMIEIKKPNKVEGIAQSLN